MYPNFSTKKKVTLQKRKRKENLTYLTKQENKNSSTLINKENENKTQKSEKPEYLSRSCLTPQAEWEKQENETKNGFCAEYRPIKKLTKI